MGLQNKFRSIVMTKLDTYTSYLVKITQNDQLAIVGKKVADAELVNVTLNGFSTSWEPFVKGIAISKSFFDFESRQDDYI